MRQFTFRLWCPATQTMSSPMKGLPWSEKHGYWFLGANREHYNCIPMIKMFWKDKAGNDVFQDDILECTRTYSDTGGSFTYKDNPGQNRPGIRLDEPRGTLTYFVIGNEHQNPELSATVRI